MSEYIILDYQMLGNILICPTKVDSFITICIANYTMK